MKKITKHCIAVAALLPLLSFFCLAQEAFQVKWSMDYTQAGTSSHPNFTPNNASLQGGANTFTLPTVYSPGGAIVVGYIVRPWPVSFSAGRFMEFTFTANSFKYNISNISFRLRRSGDGPNQVKVRTSMDGFAADLSTHVVSAASQFYAYSVPVNFQNLSANTFSVRIYAYNSASIYGTLWFDEIIVSGQVQPIILPIFLSDFSVHSDEQVVKVKWVTAREINAKEFAIERSTNLDHFNSIGTVEATGESSEPVSYEFIDPEPVSGTSYYRLRCIDRDHSFTFSNTLDLVRSTGSVQAFVLPNPASPEKIIISGLDHVPGQMQLFNLAGTSIPFELQLNDLERVILIPALPLAPGIYVLSYQNNASKEHIKILVR